MNIKKLGHCCLLIKTKSLNILTDPGIFNANQISGAIVSADANTSTNASADASQNELTGIDIILITHEHSDHLHVESLELVLKHNPNALVLTNSGVSKILKEKNITHEILEGSAEKFFSELHIQAFDGKHEEIFEEIGQVQNTGYLIDGRLFYPGDSFTVPKGSDGTKLTVEILALPVAGPWCKVSDAIRYALAVMPKYAFPVHDGQLVGERIGGSHAIPAKILGSARIEFVALKDGEERGF